MAWMTFLCTCEYNATSNWMTSKLCAVIMIIPVILTQPTRKAITYADINNNLTGICKKTCNSSRILILFGMLFCTLYIK